jgi:anti-anti-sigma regulatory factor
MEKFLLFSTGAGNDDLQNLQGNEVALYKATDLITMRPGSIRTIDLLFKSDGGHDIVTLGIKGGQHYKVLRGISQAIATPLNNNTVISIADMDGYRFIDPNIWSVSIKRNFIDVQKIDKTLPQEIPISNIARIKSVCITNTHDSTVVETEIIITDQTGNDITDTGVNVNDGSGYAATIDSTAVTVDGTAATAAIFDNERVYKSDGTVFGLCSARNSNTQITFATGLENAMTDDDDLYTGTRYKPFVGRMYPRSTLVLDSQDINFDMHTYKLYALAGAADCLEVIVRY